METERGILDLLCEPETWQEYFRQKTEKGYWSKQEAKEWKSFLEEKTYLPLTMAMKNHGYCFSAPEKKLINKFGSEKKRVVYLFNETENRILKVLAWLIYRYDTYLPQNCYSFRKDFGARRAIRTILSVRNLTEMYSYKLDIRDYFNSIDVELLLPILKRLICGTVIQKEQVLGEITGQQEQVLGDDYALYQFLEGLLTADVAVQDQTLVHEKRGAMAGTPTSALFANIYLMEMDRYFEERGTLYARYSDDIIVFAESREALEAERDTLHSFLKQYHLEVNEKKEAYSNPGESWEFLGVTYRQGELDLSRASIEKMKGKIRRKARAIYRWKLRRGAGTEQAMKVLVKVFNIKYFENPRNDEMTWCRWFFPLLTKTDGLRELDNYLQDYLRYLSTGYFTKKNYKVTYEMMKECGYRSLVHEYYREREKA